MKAVQGFMDATDFHHELGDAKGGNVVYGSIKDLKENSPCVEECGIVKVEVKKLETIQPSDYSKLVPLGEDFDEDENHLIHLRKRLESLQQMVENCRARIQYFEHKLEEKKSARST